MMRTLLVRTEDDPFPAGPAGEFRFELLVHKPRRKPPLQTTRFDPTLPLRRKTAARRGFRCRGARVSKGDCAVAPAVAEVHMNLGLVCRLQNRFPEAMTEFRPGPQDQTLPYRRKFFSGSQIIAKWAKAPRPFLT